MDVQLDTVTPQGREQLNGEMEKADRYLQSLGLRDFRRRIEILQELAAAEKGGACVMAELLKRIETWTTQQSGMPHDEGILAVWIEGVAEKDPDSFLRKQRESSNHALVHGPEFLLSKMTARPMDFGIFPAIARDTRKSLEWLPLIRAVAFWALVYVAIVLGYPRLFPS